jgi:CMP-N-acetylneuraminic acid synthetase
MKALGIIVARGGSKELLRKNVLKIGNETLIERAINSALKSKKLNKVILSTEDYEILKIAKKTNIEIPFKRPLKLAKDSSSVYDVMRHAINYLQKKQDYIPDIVVLLQCSSPFRTSLHIDKVINKLIKTRADAVITITKPDYPAYWMLKQDKNNKLKKLIENKNFYRRQLAPSIYQPAGSVYAFQKNFLMRMKGMLPQGDTRGVIIKREEAINIDTPLQFELAKIIYKNFKK